jgi:hypothetical protein
VISEKQNTAVGWAKLGVPISGSREMVTGRPFAHPTVIGLCLMGKGLQNLSDLWILALLFVIHDRFKF